MINGNIATFENGRNGFCFDLKTGKLVSVYSKITGWRLIRNSEFAQSFSLLLPVEGRRNNRAVGGTPSNVNVTDSSIEFTYNTVTSEHSGKHEITVVTHFKIDDDTAVFDCFIDNKSDLIVEDVYYPIIGDFSKPDDEQEFYRVNLGYSGIEKERIYPSFQSRVGYWGTDVPTQHTPNAPHNMFVMLTGEKQGVYIGFGELTTDVGTWKLELFPGHESSMKMNNPKEDEIGGKPCYTRVSCVQLPYITPKTQKKLVSTIIKTYEGTWHKGADIYKNLTKKWQFKLAEPPSWAKEPHSWLQIHINSPEDELRYKYTELVDIGRECAKHGIKAIQLVGWNDGGQDKGNPSHSSDDRLGTFDELKRAIAEIQAMGVKVVLFAKFTWADRSTAWFRDELIKHAVKDPYGDYYMHPGYGYQTISQILNVSTRRLVPMCFSDERYLEICNKEFEKLVALGADGMLFDECQHHGHGIICFDKSHGHKYGESNYKFGNKLIENFKKIAKSDFLYAGEANYELEFAEYQMAYFRTHVEDFVPMKRYIFPCALYMTAVTGFNDRNMLNQCLMYNFIVSYEPYNFKGRPEDYPLTLEYGKRMDKLRAELREYFWDGEFLDTTVGKVTRADGSPHDKYSVFRCAAGKIGVVICNYSEEPVTLKTEFSEELSKYRYVDGDDFLPYTKELTIEPLSAIVVI